MNNDQYLKIIQQRGECFTSPPLDEDREEFEQLLKEGYTTEALCAHYGCAKATIHKRKTAWNLIGKYPTRSEVKRIAAQRKGYVAANKDRESVAQMAETLGVSLQRIYSILKELGEPASHRNRDILNLSEAANEGVNLIHSKDPIPLAYRKVIRWMLVPIEVWEEMNNG